MISTIKKVLNLEKIKNLPDDKANRIINFINEVIDE